MNSVVSIVMYHYVRDLKHSRFPNIKGLDIHLFKEQLKYIQKLYHIINMQELIHSIESGDPLPKKAILLTFDDNYIDHFTYVFPLLEEKNIQGCFYSPVAAVQECRMLNINKIHIVLSAIEDKNKILKFIFQQLDQLRKEYRLQPNDYYFKKLAYPTRFDSKEVTCIKMLLQKELPEALRTFICDLLIQTFIKVDEVSLSKEWYMSPDQIKCMIRHGMHFGIHGYSHAWLNSLPKEEQEKEISLSIEFLKTHGANLSELTIAYPSGGYNEDTLHTLEKYNCKVGLTTEVGVANIRQHHKLKLPRLDTNDLSEKKGGTPDKWLKLA